MVKKIETSQEFKDLTSSGKTVVVDFSATWCGPCKMISPHFAKSEKDYENLTFVEVDIDELEDIAAENQIRAMPTFIAFKDGKEIERFTGAVPASLKKLLETAKAA